VIGFPVLLTLLLFWTPAERERAVSVARDTGTKLSARVAQAFSR
jgi:hypothetical protein